MCGNRSLLRERTLKDAKGQAYKGRITTRRGREIRQPSMLGRMVARNRMQSIPEFRRKHEIRGTRCFLASPFPAKFYWRLFYILSRVELFVYCGETNIQPMRNFLWSSLVVAVIVKVKRSTLGMHVWNNISI